MQWNELVKAALLGSERQTFTQPAPGEPLADALARLDASDPEGALLGAVAILTTYRQAGYNPPIQQTPLPEPCPSDNLPKCSPHAAGHLATMLNGQYTDVLPEWLRAVSAAGLRVPAQQLPALLDLGRKREDVRAALLPVLGQRGLWLARHNPDWSYAVSQNAALNAEHTEELWQTGTPTTRLALLRRLRAEDPAHARELLASTWQQDAAKERAAFVELLQANLSMDDEPFLEAALDDRSSKVRATAADLLARLPDSALVQRMKERVLPLLTFHRGGMLKKASIEVTLPEECTKAMQRDGIDPKPPDKKRGQKAWWLQQMLGMMPPAFWCEQWDATPEDLLKLVNKSEWKDMLRTGWIQATLRNPNAAWARAWFDAYPGMTNELITVLPSEDGEAGIVRVLAADSLHQAAALLEYYPHTWSLELSRAVLDAVRRHVTNKKENRKSYWHMQQIFNILPYRMPAEMADEAARAWAKTEGESWMMHESYLQEPLAILQFRYEMLEALKEAKP